MVRKVISSILIAAILLTTYGCSPRTSQRAFPTDPDIPSETITEVVLTNGDRVLYDELGARYQLRGFISGKTVEGSQLMLPLREVKAWRYTLVDTATGKRVEAATQLPSYTAFIDTTVRVSGLISSNEFQYAFSSEGGRISGAMAVINGVDRQTKLLRTVPIDSVLYLRVERVDAALAVLSVISVLALLAGIGFLIVLATKQSCPFLYSYDGQRYIFDAEPLGGATVEALARTDVSRLEHLKPVGGKYRLLVRNEVNETQYIDEMRLLVVDHDPGVAPIAESPEKFVASRRVLAPISAIDENGTSLMPFLAFDDSVAWQTDLRRIDPARSSLRQTLTITFPKPANVKRAHLVVHGGTTLWGSNMIRKMYELHGDSVESLYQRYNAKGPEFYEMLQFIEREELYELKVHVKKEGGWSQRGTITGGGPLIHEIQRVPLGISGISGDRVEVQLQPPVGFWSLDFIGVEYDEDQALPFLEVAPIAAVSWAGDNFIDLLEKTDRRYVCMPKTGDSYVMEFPVPPVTEGRVRTVFVKTGGYYALHLDDGRPRDSATIERIVREPGAIVRLAIERYHQWERTETADGRPFAPEMP